MIPVLLSALLAVGSILAALVAALVCLVLGNLGQAIFFAVLGFALFCFLSPTSDQLRRATATLKHWRETIEQKPSE